MDRSENLITLPQRRFHKHQRIIKWTGRKISKVSQTQGGDFLVHKICKTLEGIFSFKYLYRHIGDFQGINE